MREYLGVRMRSVLCLVLFSTLLTGCAFYLAPFQPPQGGILTNVKAPLSVNFDSTPVCSTYGDASTFYVRDILLTGQTIAWGRCDIETAAKNGNLATVEYADYEYLQVLGIFGLMKVTAYGK
ncbi:MAG: hypothetical protein J7L53_00625 [Deltaproteobacteria bacterium]|nr:hypothetical protein [Deltaproteobacteria bacterium]